MVQLKYFGDSRDYFKYDLITYLLKSRALPNYSFVPMLTNHRVDGEGNKLPKYIAGKSHVLLSFIDSCNTKDLDHWEVWMGEAVEQYKTVHPVNETFFHDSARGSYWKLFKEVIAAEHCLVFIDPDTGLETGCPSYLRKMGREKYILNEELSKVVKVLDESSVLMIYQHLPNNKHVHKEAVIKKITQAMAATNCPNVMAYREDDLAFIFVAKNPEVFLSLSSLLGKYHEISGHKYKSIHFAPSN